MQSHKSKALGLVVQNAQLQFVLSYGHPLNPTATVVEVPQVRLMMHFQTLPHNATCEDEQSACIDGAGQHLFASSTVASCSCVMQTVCVEHLPYACNRQLQATTLCGGGASGVADKRAVARSNLASG
jgi:hypothetical protein